MAKLDYLDPETLRYAASLLIDKISFWDVQDKAFMRMRDVASQLRNQATRNEKRNAAEKKISAELRLSAVESRQTTIESLLKAAVVALCEYARDS